METAAWAFNIRSVGSAADRKDIYLDTLEIRILSFEEFLMAMDRYDFYEKLDIYGGSGEETHRCLRSEV